MPLLVREPSSPRSKALLKEDPVVLAWWAAEVECTSALARLERDQSLSRKAALSAYQRLAAFRDAWNEVQPNAGLKEIATRLLRVHVLRAADALQLAAAILARKDDPRRSVSSVLTNALLPRPEKRASKLSAPDRVDMPWMTGAQRVAKPSFTRHVIPAFTALYGSHGIHGT